MLTDGDLGGDVCVRTPHPHQLLPALEHVEQVARTRGSNGTPCASALVLTGASTREGASNKFFSNGLDLPKALKTPYFFRDVFGKLLARLITFPLFTVAAINGHCFAGGLCLALARLHLSLHVTRVCR